MRELAELVIGLSGSKSKISFLDLPPDDPKQRQPQIALARELLGWHPTIELEQGLAKTIDYFRAVLK
jgi:UDP-glucuronate decarboxylase